MKMTDTNYYLDQLDILSEYMKYWIEFRDKERKEYEEKAVHEFTREGGILETINAVNEVCSVFGFGEIQSNIIRQEPYPFCDVIKIFNNVQDMGNVGAKGWL